MVLPTRRVKTIATAAPMVKLWNIPVTPRCVLCCVFGAGVEPAQW